MASSKPPASAPPPAKSKSPTSHLTSPIALPLAISATEALPLATVAMLLTGEDAVFSLLGVVLITLMTAGFLGVAVLGARLNRPLRQWDENSALAFLSIIGWGVLILAMLVFNKVNPFLVDDGVSYISPFALTSLFFLWMLIRGTIYARNRMIVAHHGDHPIDSSLKLGLVMMSLVLFAALLLPGMDVLLRTLAVLFPTFVGAVVITVALGRWQVLRANVGEGAQANADNTWPIAVRNIMPFPLLMALVVVLMLFPVISLPLWNVITALFRWLFAPFFIIFSTLFGGGNGNGGGGQGNGSSGQGEGAGGSNPTPSSTPMLGIDGTPVAVGTGTPVSSTPIVGGSGVGGSGSPVVTPTPAVHSSGPSVDIPFEIFIALGEVLATALLIWALISFFRWLLHRPRRKRVRADRVAERAISPRLSAKVRRAGEIDSVRAYYQRILERAADVGGVYARQTAETPAEYARRLRDLIAQPGSPLASDDVSLDAESLIVLDELTRAYVVERYRGDLTTDEARRHLKVGLPRLIAVIRGDMGGRRHRES